MQPTSRSRAFLALAAAAVGIAMLGVPSAGLAAVSPDDARLAAAKGAAWIQARQSADGALGAFGGDWAMIALANAGVHAADVRTAAGNPSAQDYYAADWTGAFPLEGMSISRGLLTGRAAGIQTAKLSATENLVAKLAGEFDGEQLGSKELVNDDMFGVLGLSRAGAVRAISPMLARAIRRAQTTDGGWAYTSSAAAGDVDMTGAAIASLCAAGATPADPAVAAGLDFLKSTQNDANGGFDSAFFGPNADSTAWVVDGLRQCGIDPQGPRWTTSTGKTPLDFLVSLQRPDGAIRWQPGDTSDNLYATQDAITALAGNGFGAEPPARANPAEPQIRPAADVPSGTTVPLTLVLDHDPTVPGADRICSIKGAVGAPLADVLHGAAQTAAPAGCVSGLAVAADGRVTAIDGVSEQPGAATWEVSLDGEPARSALAGTVQLGSVISLSLGRVAGGATFKTQQPTPIPAVSTVAGDRPRLVAKARLPRNARLRVSRAGSVRIFVRCPGGVGAIGCRGVVAVKYRPARASGLTRLGGRRTFALRSGEGRPIVVKLSRKLRALIRRSRGALSVRIEAAVRNPETGATAVSRASARIDHR